jgi:hypothetical protein
VCAGFPKFCKEIVEGTTIRLAFTGSPLIRIAWLKSLESYLSGWKVIERDAVTKHRFRLLLQYLGIAYRGDGSLRQPSVVGHRILLVILAIVVIIGGVNVESAFANGAGLAPIVVRLIWLVFFAVIFILAVLRRPRRK